MSVALWSLFVGILLITMVLAGTLLARLPTSSAMIYLAAGYAPGPAGLAVITPDPTRYAPAVELAAEVAVLISLLSVGLRMDVPLRDRRSVSAHGAAGGVAGPELRLPAAGPAAARAARRAASAERTTAAEGT